MHELSYIFAGQRTSCGSWFSPSALCIVRIKTQVIRLIDKGVYPLSYLPCPFVCSYIISKVRWEYTCPALNTHSSLSCDEFMNQI